MGYGTGVLRAYYAVSLMRGLTVGVSGASSMYIAQKSGAPQNFLVAARGVGLVVAPVALARLIGRILWSGNSQYGFAVALVCKVIAELVIARASEAIPLYSAFLVIGVSMALLDTLAQMLITRVHKENCGLPMMIYCAVYGIGCTIAPYLTLRFAFQSWDILALMDLLVAVAVAGRRAFRGKPRDWKLKIRGAISPTETPGEAPLKPLPSRVLRAGMAFVFMAQATETAMSCWAFTFAASSMGLPPRVAALFHATFYFTFTTTRLLVLPISAKVLPSAITQIGTMMTLVGSSLFFSLTRGFSVPMVTSYPEEKMGDVNDTLDTAHDMVGLLNNSVNDLLGQADEAPAEVVGTSELMPILISLALIGAGSCPLYAMMLGAVRRHGDLNHHQQGLFMTSYSSGITVGMWLPGLVSLPYVEMLGSTCMLLIMASHLKEFPFSDTKKGHA